MTERKPDDGQPYYCIHCGHGLAEFNACELPDCELEQPHEARRRISDRDNAFLKQARAH
jgi:hypothetical protein